jgi:hypothetical protein
VLLETFDGFPIRSGFVGADWALENCAAAALQHPETFEVPSAAEASMVRIGDLLRLHFLLTDPATASDPETPRAERMWVEVCALATDGIFRGHLTNQPVHISSLEPGDVVEFLWEHVARVYVTKDDPRNVGEHN